MKIGVIFNGQGGQFPNMGLDFIKEYPEAQAVLKEIEEELDIDIKSWLQEDFDRLKETRYAQLAIAGISMSIYRSLESKLRQDIDSFAGLSLGEYSALVAGGYLNQKDLWPLLKLRGELMSQACQEVGKAGLLAVMDMPLEAIDQIIKELGLERTLTIANYNAPFQYILAGHNEDFRLFQRRAKEQQYRKILPIKVEGPFHSPYMESILPQYQKVLRTFTFKLGQVPVWSNVTARPYQEGELPNLLAQHLVEPVRWMQVMEAWDREGIRHIFQIGPGDTLAKLLERHLPHMKVFVINQVDDLEGVETFLGGRHE